MGPPPPGAGGRSPLLVKEKSQSYDQTKLASNDNLTTGSAGSTRVETCVGCGENLEGADALMELMGQICSLKVSLTPTYEISKLGFAMHRLLHDLTIARTAMSLPQIFP